MRGGIAISKFSVGACCQTIFILVIELPTESSDFSMIMGQIKRTYSLVAKPRLIGSVKPNSSQKKKREVGIWQRRFYEHAIRDDRDLSNHIEYIHWNPMKHGEVSHPLDWPYSSYHDFCDKGFYTGAAYDNRQFIYHTIDGLVTRISMS